jgi:DNA-binding SARP family transcriptional activator
MALPTSHWLQLWLLGTWRLERLGQEVELNRREQRLIALLALSGPRPRSWLAGTLWPEATEPRALSSLRATVMRTNRAAGDLLMVTRTGLRLSDELFVDLEQVRSGPAGLLLAPGVWDVCLDHTRLQAPLLLPGWYDDWVLSERERLHRDWVLGLERLAVEALEHGALQIALQAAEEAVALEPLRERPQSLAIEAHLARGDRPAAVLQYRLYRQHLDRELGIEPSPSLRAMVAASGRPAGALRDLRTPLP